MFLVVTVHNFICAINTCAIYLIESAMVTNCYGTLQIDIMSTISKINAILKSKCFCISECICHYTWTHFSLCWPFGSPWAKLVYVVSSLLTHSNVLLQSFCRPIHGLPGTVAINVVRKAENKQTSKSESLPKSSKNCRMATNVVKEV